MTNVRAFSFIVCIGIFFCVGITENIAAATSCDVNFTEPDFYVHGLCFSPYIDGQAPPNPVSVEQIQERLAIITQKPHTQWIRTYTATNGFEDIPSEAKSLGLKVAMGTWIRDNKETEINNLVAKAQLGLVDIAVVGNEELYAGASTANGLISDLNYVRQQLNDVNCTDIPVTTAEPFETLFSIDGKGVCTLNYPSLIDAMDMVFVNMYPFHEGVNIDNALADIALKYQSAVNAVHQRDVNKAVIISETGWPSDGLTKVDAEPSLYNLAKYFSEISKWAGDSNIPIFYFAAFDEKWKAPPEVEAHWGIWDSNGYLKHTLVSEPVLCETFDPPVNLFYPRREWSWQSTAPDPNIMVGDSNSDGQYLRLLYDGTGVTHFSSAAFNRVAVGLFSRIVAEFDFRLYGPDANNDADGFAFMLIPTLLNGTTGCSKYSPSDFFAEEPKLPKTFGVGFGIYGSDKVCISWDGKLFPNEQQIQVPVNLDNSNWHHAKIDIRAFDVNKAKVSVILTPDIRTPTPGNPIAVVDNLEINDSNHPYAPYENRIEFAGRNGGLDINADIDNICVHYKPGICDGLAGDANGDCKIDLFDLAIMANNWLVNCNLIPDDPICASE
jgi:exo-beta-1,3-glucanase (GH17 family)